MSAPTKTKGMGGHQSARMQKDEWLTPPWILERLGCFDLDPCASVSRPWPTANDHLTINEDGLLQPWHGRVWCNPPYGQHTVMWLEKCFRHGNAIALIFARTETDMFFEYVWPFASALLFIRGRLHFYDIQGRRADANSGAPSVLVAYGNNNADCLYGSGIPGAYVGALNQGGPQHSTQQPLPGSAALHPNAIRHFR